MRKHKTGSGADPGTTKVRTRSPFKSPRSLGTPPAYLRATFYMSVPFKSPISRQRRSCNGCCRSCRPPQPRRPRLGCVADSRSPIGDPPLDVTPRGPLSWGLGDPRHPSSHAAGPVFPSRPRNVPGIPGFVCPCCPAVGFSFRERALLLLPRGNAMQWEGSASSE